MDDLYENLDNYNEENTISELQAENRELKSKLTEYADTLTQLQTDILQDFDKLTSEYKQLEFNYSSLLKTAKAEVERKTQIIYNLNLEKDKMVLKCFQNKNTGSFYKSRESDSPGRRQNHKKDQYDKSKQDEKLKSFDGKKSSPHSAPERKEQDESLSRDKTTNSRADLRSKLLNLAHKSQQHESRTEQICAAMENMQHYDQNTQKTSDAKENIIQPRKESEEFKARASIRNRRKSMPALRIEAEPFSDDDDSSNVVSSINLQHISSEHNSSEKQKLKDHYFHERPKSRISETSSLEEKKSGHNDDACASIQNRHKQRFSRYDRDKSDNKYIVRHKSSHRYKRQSPDRYQYRSGPKEYHDPYRSEQDRHKGKRLQSPPRDQFHHRTSRELHRDYERSHHYEYDRTLPHSQERYPMKRRIEHGYEFENKRLRVEPYSKRSEDKLIDIDNKRIKMELSSRNPKDDRQMKEETKVIDNKYISDPLEVQFSCESPDYVQPDVSNQPVPEVKVTAFSEMEDPRIKNEKYLLRNSNGQAILTTTIGRNVDLVPLTKADWGIIPESMPEALLQRPLELKKSAYHETMDVDRLSNVSFESGEICDSQCTNHPNQVQKLNKLKVPISETKEPPEKVPISETKEPPVLITCDNSEVKKNSSKKSNSYKIPKLSKSVSDKQIGVNTKDITTSVKLRHDNTDCMQNSGTAIISINLDKKGEKRHRREKEPESHTLNCYVTQSKGQLPCLGPSNTYEQNYATAKEVVEGDLEMSDDNCDDNDKIDHLVKETVIKGLENKTKDENRINRINTEKSKDNTEQPSSKDNAQKQCKEEKHFQHNTEKITKDDVQKTPKNNVEKPFTDIKGTVAEPCKDMTFADRKKSKTKKKSKHKEARDACKNDDLIKVFEKPAKKKETKLAHIKTKFSELFDDSSSLISPEDLGLATIPVSTTLLPDKCVPFFEDAVDAVDVSSMKGHAVDVSSVKGHADDVSSMQNHTVDASTMKGHAVDVSSMKSHAVDVSSMKGHAVDVSSMKGHAVDVSSMKSHAVDVSSMKGHAVDVSSMKSHVVDASSVKGYAVDVSSMQNHTVDASTMKGHAVDVSSMKGYAVDVSSKKGHAVDVSSMKSHAVDVSSMKGHAVDVSLMKGFTNTTQDSIPPEKSNIDSKIHGDGKVPKIDLATNINYLENSIDNSGDGSRGIQTEMSDDVIKSIYQNLEPDVPEEQDNVIKTVIISTGVQPPLLLEKEKQMTLTKPELQIRTIHEVDLKALATSTPHKLPDLVTTNIGDQLPGCNSNNNNSQLAIAENTTKDKSDSNTIDSQTNEASVPDVRIFVKRRRKVTKK